MIQAIRIKNVRGIEDQTFNFQTPEMYPNKVHLLIAPNGFGKSSIASAFDNLKPNSLRLKERQLFRHDENRKAELNLYYKNSSGQSTELSANFDKNELNSIFDINVIKAPGKLRATMRPNGAGFNIPIAELIIEDIDLCKIPEKIDLDYSISNIRRIFGKNGKVLPNIADQLNDPNLLESFCNNEYSRLALLKIPQSKILKFQESLNSLEGTSEQILTAAENSLVNELDSVESLKNISQLFEKHISSRCERYLAAIQLICIHKSGPKKIPKLVAWLRHELNYERVTKLLNSCNPNCSWIKLEVKRTSGRLVISLPKPDSLSNGQRDFLSFVANLIKIELSIKKPKSIIIIDEIFDYLDYSNLIACQYFLSKLIASHKSDERELYPIILTHLDPGVFNSFVFSKKLQKNHYLDKYSEINPNAGLHKIIQARADPEFEPIFSKYFAHYHPDDCDEKALFESKGLKKNWGCSKTFRAYCHTEAGKYASNTKDNIDYLAVCLYLRVNIEKHAYKQLPTAELHQSFINTLKTIPKLDYAIEQGASVPEVHYLLATLYNSALHPIDSKSDSASPVVSKMININIMGMVKEAFQLANVIF